MYCCYWRKKQAAFVSTQVFYHGASRHEERPKIFGMTASLVDKKSTISCDQGFAELQQNLNCVIMTANVGQYTSKAVQKGLVFEKSVVVSRLNDTDRWVVLLFDVERKTGLSNVNCLCNGPSGC